MLLWLPTARRERNLHHALAGLTLKVPIATAAADHATVTRQSPAEEVTTGRTFGIRFDHGEDFFPTLTAFCRDHGIRQGYIPMFIAGFSEAEIVGTCEKLQNPDAPVWSKVHVTNVEALGCGTIADDGAGGILPHIHSSLGLKERSATAHTSHLLSARVQFLVEMLIVEVASPAITRPRNPDLYDVPLLHFAGE